MALFNALSNRCRLCGFRWDIEYSQCTRSDCSLNHKADCSLHYQRLLHEAKAKLLAMAESISGLDLKTAIFVPFGQKAADAPNIIPLDDSCAVCNKGQVTDRRPFCSNQSCKASWGKWNAQHNRHGQKSLLFSKPRLENIVARSSEKKIKDALINEDESVQPDALSKSSRRRRSSLD